MSCRAEYEDVTGLCKLATPDEVREQMLATTSLRSTMTAQDVADMALFLATEPGRHITGQAISICADLRYYPD